MKIYWDQTYIKYSFYVVITAIILYISKNIIDHFGALFRGIGTFFGHVGSLFSPFIWALVLAYLLHPIVCLIEKSFHRITKLKKKEFVRFLSVLLTYILVIGILVLGIRFIVPQVSKSYDKLEDKIPYYMQQIEEYQVRLDIANAQLYYSNVPEEWKLRFSQLVERIVQTFSNLILMAGTSIIRFTQNLLTIILAPIIAFYILKDLEYFKHGYNRITRILVPMDYRIRMQSFFKSIDEVLSNFIRGQLLDAAIVGVMSVIGLKILKIEFAVLIGILAGITNVIPYFGPVIGAAPAVILGLISGDPMKAVWAIVLFVIIQQIDSAIISPRVVGGSVGLHPIFVIASIVIAGTYFGLIGMIIAVPIAAIIKISIERFLENREIKLTQEG